MSNFSFEPHTVTPGKNYKVYSTPAEAVGKKEILLLDDIPEQTFELLFKAQTREQYQALVEHYDNHYGPAIQFVWDSVPGSINYGIEMTVRYAEQDGLSAKPLEAGLWEIRINLEYAP